MTSRLSVWTNALFPEPETHELKSGVAPHDLVPAAQGSSLNLVAAPPDPGLERADIAFGQPDVEQLFSISSLRWVHLTTAGYTAYDRDDLRSIFRERGTIMTNSSGVYDEPCAQHAMAMLLCFARQLHVAGREQRGQREWSYVDMRKASFLLQSQSILIYGFGAIGKRLCELLRPFGPKVVGVRRSPQGDETVPVVPLSAHLEYLSQADHVINILPASPETDNFFDLAMFKRMKPGAFFYNIGRGTSVVQAALADVLHAQALSGAYLDVTNPEPLPATDPLWDAPNCYITPHTAGGFAEEMSALVQHFLGNLRRFERGESLVNRII